jgi:hypothetical protein
MSRASNIVVRASEDMSEPNASEYLEHQRRILRRAGFCAMVDHPQVRNRSRGGRDRGHARRRPGPGAFVHDSDPVLQKPSCGVATAPAVGEHTTEVVGELGFTVDEIVAMRDAKVVE